MDSFHILTTTCFLWSRIGLLALSLPVVFVGCASTGKDLNATKYRASLRDVDDANWRRLAERKVFFGHQSVGTNIIEGIQDLERENPQLRLNIVNSKNPSAVSAPAFVESLIGKNGDPRSKTATFLSTVDAGLGSQSAIAMYKFCFADMSRDTDVRGMFDEYRTAVDSVHAKYPGLTIVHITMPLTTSEGLWKALAKKLMQKPLERDLAVKRNQFNRLLHQQYDGKEPIFDLAAAESTGVDGKRVFFEYDSHPVYALAPEFTDDGAHLNKLGRRVVAEQFLLALARI